MKKYSLYSVVLGIFLILIIGVFVTVYLSVTQHKKDLIETTIDEKTVLASSVNEIIFSPTLLLLSRYALASGVKQEVFITEIAKARDIRYIRIVKMDGTIQQSSLEEKWLGVVEDPAIVEAITTKRTIVKDEVFEGEKIKTIIYPGYQNNTIWIGFSLKNIEKIIQTMFIRNIAITSGILILIVLVTFLMLRTIINPIKQMTLVCEEIGKENLDVKIDVKSKTEIGELADTFKKMLEDLKKSKVRLEESKNVLEVKVEARTKELRELAESLEEKVKRRTKELQERVSELERFHKLTVGREAKMLELKEKIKKLEAKLKENKS